MSPRARAPFYFWRLNFPRSPPRFFWSVTSKIRKFRSFVGDISITFNNGNRKTCFLTQLRTHYGPSFWNTKNQSSVWCCFLDLYPPSENLAVLVGEQHGESGSNRFFPASACYHLLLAWGRRGNGALLHSVERRSERKSSRRRPQNLTHCTGADRAGTSNSAFGNCFFNSQILNFQVSNFEGNVPASFSIVSDNKKKYDFDVSVPL